MTSSYVKVVIPDSQRSEKNLVWIDCEMTGLDAHLPPASLNEEELKTWQPDQIIEIAVIITNADLEVLHEGIEFVVRTDKVVLDRMGEWCTEQHGKTGLTAACQSEAALPMKQIDAQCSAYLRQFFPTDFKMMLLAGSSIGQDKIFLQKDLPELFDLLHYRVLDVSSLKELGARWTTLPERPRYVSDHRARSDILSSIEELKFYREHLFKKS